RSGRASTAPLNRWPADWTTQWQVSSSGRWLFDAAQHRRLPKELTSRGALRYDSLLACGRAFEPDGKRVAASGFTVVSTDDNSLDYECDWRMGFNLNPSSKGRVGYLLFWSGCGGLSLSKDIEVYNPYTGSGQTVETGTTIKCIGLIESFKFGG